MQMVHLLAPTQKSTVHVPQDFALKYTVPAFSAYTGMMVMMGCTRCESCRAVSNGVVSFLSARARRIRLAISSVGLGKKPSAVCRVTSRLRIFQTQPRSTPHPPRMKGTRSLLLRHTPSIISGHCTLSKCVYIMYIDIYIY